MQEIIKLNGYKITIQRDDELVEDDNEIQHISHYDDFKKTFKECYKRHNTNHVKTSSFHQKIMEKSEVNLNVKEISSFMKSLGYKRIKRNGIYHYDNLIEI